MAKKKSESDRINKRIKERDKGTGQGLSLQISLGQSVNVDGVAQTQSLGHIQITTHTPTAEDAPEA